MGKSQRTKGSGYERKIAKAFEEWSGEQVNRTPASGALGSTGWQGQSNVSGDIVFPQESKCPFTIECKKHEIDNLHKQVFFSQAHLANFWKQCTEDAFRLQEQNKIPMLVFSKNREKNYVILPFVQRLWDRMYGNYPISRQQLTYHDIQEREMVFDTVFLVLDDLLEAYDKDTLFKLYSTKKAKEWNHLNKEE